MGVSRERDDRVVIDGARDQRRSYLLGIPIGKN